MLAENVQLYKVIAKQDELIAVSAKQMKNQEELINLYKAQIQILTNQLQALEKYFGDIKRILGAQAPQ